MRILVCAGAAPLPPITGFRLALEALLTELGREHEIHVLAFRSPEQRPPADQVAMTLVEPRRVRVVTTAGTHLAALARGRPCDVDRLAKAMTPALTQALATLKPDVVHVTSARLAALGRRLSQWPSVMVPLDAAYLGVESRALASNGLARRYLRTEAKRMMAFEAREYRHFGRVVVVSEGDRQALEAAAPELEVTVIPNGVDSSFYSPDARTAVDRDRIVFTGVMSAPPNTVAAERLATEILPLVRAVRPNARLAIVGRDPPARVRALAALEGVAVTGEVPDVRPWLAGSRVFACPMAIGTGIKNKLLEAMATALPCVATPLALRGLVARPGEELLVAERDEDLAAEIVRVLDDDELAGRLGESARAYVLAHHTWPAAARAYERVYREVREASSAPTAQPRL